MCVKRSALPEKYVMWMLERAEGVILVDKQARARGGEHEHGGMALGEHSRRASECPPYKKAAVCRVPFLIITVDCVPCGLTRAGR